MHFDQWFWIHVLIELMNHIYSEEFCEGGYSCYNGGSCLESPDGITGFCNCSLGYEGTVCQTAIVSVSAFVSDHVTLSCPGFQTPASMPSGYKLTWYKDRYTSVTLNHLVAEYVVRQDNGSRPTLQGALRGRGTYTEAGVIAIHNVQLSDEGYYTCDFTSHPRQQIHLTANIRPTPPTIAPLGTLITTEENGKLDITCIESRIKPQARAMFWLYGHTTTLHGTSGSIADTQQPDSNKTEMENSTVQNIAINMPAGTLLDDSFTNTHLGSGIYLVQNGLSYYPTYTDHLGYLTCVVFPIQGQNESTSVQLLVLHSPKGYPNITADHTQLPPGAKAKLNCDTSYLLTIGNPPADTFFWYRDGELHSRTLGGVLSVKASDANEGNWSCRVENSRGQSYVSPIIYLDVDPAYVNPVFGGDNNKLRIILPIVVCVIVLILVGVIIILVRKGVCSSCKSKPADLPSSELSAAKMVGDDEGYVPPVECRASQADQEHRYVLARCSVHGRPDKLGFEKGDLLVLVDSSDPDWWIVQHTKTNRKGRVSSKHVSMAENNETEYYSGQTLEDLYEAMRDQWEIPRQSLQLLDRVGRGQFGDVWKGRWNGVADVAVKTLQQDALSTDEFLQEAQIMKQLQHENLVRLYAVCTHEEPIYIVTEFMRHGSLLEFLREGEGHDLSFTKLISLASQVANGMAYLESKSYIHRDLAARNVLVDDRHTAKVADFGLARLTSGDEYNAKAGSKTAVRWTAPEALMYRKFSIKSDIWSYGILLTEIFTHGQNPYAGLVNAEVLEYVTSGRIISHDSRWPEDLYACMEQCWLWQPELRPSFYTLRRFFKNYQGPYITMNDDQNLAIAATSV